jgi:hypothetical protein
MVRSTGDIRVKAHGDMTLHVSKNVTVETRKDITLDVASLNLNTALGETVAVTGGGGLKMDEIQISGASLVSARYEDGLVLKNKNTKSDGTISLYTGGTRGGITSAVYIGRGKSGNGSNVTLELGKNPLRNVTQIDLASITSSTNEWAESLTRERTKLIQGISIPYNETIKNAFVEKDIIITPIGTGRIIINATSTGIHCDDAYSNADGNDPAYVYERSDGTCWKHNPSPDPRVQPHYVPSDSVMIEDGMIRNVNFNNIATLWDVNTLMGSHMQVRSAESDSSVNLYSGNASQEGSTLYLRHPSATRGVLDFQQTNPSDGNDASICTTKDSDDGSEGPNAKCVHGEKWKLQEKAGVLTLEGGSIKTSYQMTGAGKCQTSNGTASPSKYEAYTNSKVLCADACTAVSVCFAYEYCTGSATCEGKCNLLVSTKAPNGQAPLGFEFIAGVSGSFACETLKAATGWITWTKVSHETSRVPFELNLKAPYSAKVTTDLLVASNGTERDQQITVLSESKTSKVQLSGSHSTSVVKSLLGMHLSNCMAVVCKLSCRMKR